MANLIKIDKRDNQDGYCILAGDGWVNIIQGGQGNDTRLITLPDADLEHFMADLDNAINQRAKQHVKAVS